MYKTILHLLLLCTSYVRQLPERNVQEFCKNLFPVVIPAKHKKIGNLRKFHATRCADFDRKRGSRDGTVVRALASHQCGPGSVPSPGVIRGLSLLLVLVLAPWVFLWVLRFSSLHKNQHFQIPIPPACKVRLIILI